MEVQAEVLTSLEEKLELQTLGFGDSLVRSCRGMEGLVFVLY